MQDYHNADRLQEKKFPHVRTFRALPSADKLLEIACKVLGKPATYISGYWQHGNTRTDAADILLRLMDSPGWNDKLQLIETPNGGLQQDGNTRLFELRQRLKAHGLSIACLEDHSGARTASYYRLCWEDELPRSTSGRVRPYTIGGSTPFGVKPARAVTGLKPESPKPAQSAAQPNLFRSLQDVQQFCSYETGGSR